MRIKRTIQSSIFDIFAGHQIGRELKAMSAWLDGVGSKILDLVVGDLGDAGVMETGRQGLPAESVLRCSVLKQYRQLSYEELAFHLRLIPLNQVAATMGLAVDLKPAEAAWNPRQQ